MVPRRQADRLRLLGLARAEGRQGAGEALEGVEGAQGERLRHLARRSTASGTATCRWAGSPTCTCSTSPAAASSTCSRAPGSSCSAWTRTPTSSTSRPTAGTSSSSSILRRRSASTTARRWRRSTSPAAGARRWRSIPPGISRRRATARTAGGSPSSPATWAAATPRPRNVALLERGGSWRVLTGAWDHAVNAPLRWSADGSALWFTAEDRARGHLWRFAIESASAAIAAEGGWVHWFDVAGDTVVTVADAMRPSGAGACPPRRRQGRCASSASTTSCSRPCTSPRWRSASSPAPTTSRCRCG